MAFFYVDSIGTRVAGGGLTEQTGSMAALGAANIYANIPAAISDGAGAGDNIRQAHNYTRTASATITHTGPTSGVPLVIESVDDANIDQYLAGAGENTGGTNFDWNPSGYINYNGFDITFSDECSPASNTVIQFRDCTIDCGDSGDQFFINADGVLLRFINSNLTFGTGSSGSGFFVIRGGSRVEWFGGAVSGANTADHLVGPSSGSNGGYTILCQGVDLNNIDTSLVSAINGAGTDIVLAQFRKCRFNAAATLTDTGVLNYGQRVEAYQCSSTSAAAQGKIDIEDYAGTVTDQDDSGIHRGDSETFPNGDRISYECTTNSNCSIYNPLSFEIPSRRIELSSGSSDQIRVYLAISNATTLTDTNFWVDVVSFDGTDNHVANFYTSRNADYLATGTTLTDDSGSSDWRDGGSALTAHNEYRVDVDTSGDPAADGVPVLRINIAEPSVTVYVDVTIDGVA